jgi:hypothetical protein
MILAGTTVLTNIAIVAVTTMFNAKTFAALLGVAVITGTGIYLVEQRQAQRLEAENQILLAQRVQASADQDAGAKAAQATEDQLERLRKDNAELLQLRNEVTQLRRERDARKQQASQATPPAERAGQSASEAGPYISKEQLAFVGYATPDAAVESMTWAMMKGTYEQSRAALGPELLKHEDEDAKAREQFETGRKAMAPLFKGLQIVARKTLGEDRVELKLKMDADPLPDSKADMPPFFIQPMVKVGNEWKLGGSTRGYQPEWDDAPQPK